MSRRRVGLFRCRWLCWATVAVTTDMLLGSTVKESTRRARRDKNHEMNMRIRREWYRNVTGALRVFNG